MTKADLQQVAEERLSDAKVLLAAGRWSAAYYLLGYVVECALKACVSKQFKEFEVPEKKLVLDFYTHNLDQLLNISGIKDQLLARAKSDPAFETNWQVVKDWSESTRYDHTTSEAKARDMLVAVEDGASGVLAWLKTQW
jgi:HEPN domain-containing protein